MNPGIVSEPLRIRAAPVGKHLYVSSSVLTKIMMALSPGKISSLFSVPKVKVLFLISIYYYILSIRSMWNSENLQFYFLTFNLAV